MTLNVEMSNDSMSLSAAAVFLIIGQRVFVVAIGLSIEY